MNKWIERGDATIEDLFLVVLGTLYHTVCQMGIYSVYRLMDLEDGPYFPSHRMRHYTLLSYS